MKIKHIIFLTALAPALSHSGVVSDWVDKARGASNASGYHTGTRGYYSAGSISARVPSSAEFIMSINPPRLVPGACGNDLFLGGMSFMDIEYIGEKLESMWQNADSVALSMAMSALSKTLEEKGQDFMAVVDKLNNMQFDECALSQEAITYVVENAPKAYDKLFKEEAQTQEKESGLTKNSQDSNESASANGGQPKSEVDIGKSIAACEQPIKDIFSGNGSIIRRLVSKYGISSQENLIRGLIGDLYISHEGDGDAPVAAVYPPCDDNDLNTMDDFIYGTAKQQSRPTSLNADTTGKCSAAITNGGLVGHSVTMLSQLADRLKDPNNSIVSTSELSKYLNSTPIPVYPIIKSATELGIETEIIGEISLIVAYASAYAFINDLQRAMSSTFANLEATIQAQSKSDTEATLSDESGDAVAAKCDLKPYLPIIDKIGMLRKRLVAGEDRIHERYMAKLSEINKLIQFNRNYEKLKVTAKFVGQ